MVDYRTRMFDGQIGFGSGSKVNADDIPETTTRFWLTNTAQEISGSKIFGDDLDMSFNNITNVADPVSNRDVATKKYVDAKSPLTTKGDLYTHSTADTRLPIGTDGQRLIVDSGESLGMRWGGITNVETAKFSITSKTEIIAASGSSVISIVGISMHNNDSTGSNDTQVRLIDGSGSAYLYGGADGNIYLPGRGGVWVLPPSTEFAYFSGSSGNGIYLEPVAGKRVAGAVWYSRS